MKRQILSAITYQPNRATLHTHVGLLPRNRRAWASWNHHRLQTDTGQATLTYHLNQLQTISSRTPVLVTLNRDDAIDPELVLARIDYAHPVLDRAAVAAQQPHAGIYAQADRLGLREAPFYTHPARRSLRPSAVRRARC